MNGAHTQAHLLYENGILFDVAWFWVGPVLKNVNNVVGLNFGFDLPFLLGPSYTTILILPKSTINICWHRTNTANLFIMMLIIILSLILNLIKYIILSVRAVPYANWKNGQALLLHTWHYFLSFLILYCRFVPISWVLLESSTNFSTWALFVLVYISVSLRNDDRFL